MTATQSLTRCAAVLILALAWRQQNPRRRRTRQRGTGDRIIRILDQDDDGQINRAELNAGLRMLGVKGNEAIAGKILQNADADGDGLISIKEWEACVEGSSASPTLSQTLGELDVTMKQLADILRYAFTQLDENDDGRICYQEFQVACGLMGLNLPPAICKQAFNKLSGGLDYIQKEKPDDADPMTRLALSVQSALRQLYASEGFEKAEYILSSMQAAMTRTDVPIPQRLQLAVEAFWSKADFLSDFTETASDLVGIIFAFLSIGSELNCLPNCQADPIDATNLIPLVILLRRTFTNSMKKLQDVSVRDLNSDMACVFSLVFKPAGFSVTDFQQIYQQGEAEWRLLPAGMQMDHSQDRLQLIVRGSVKVLSQSIVPGLSEPSLIVEAGTFLGAARLMDEPSEDLEQGRGQYISVMEDTLVLVWREERLERYFQVHPRQRQLFQVMLARSVEGTMGQVSHQAQRMAVELPILFRDFIVAVKVSFGVDRATLWVHNKKKDVLWTLFVAESGKTSYVCVDASSGIAGCCLTEGRALNIPDCYQDERFNRKVDQRTGYYTKNTLCVPVFSKEADDARPVGVVQLINKFSPEFLATGGTSEDPDFMFAHFTNADVLKAGQSMWLTSLMIKQLSSRYNIEREDDV